jgi:hypothetical protein
MSTQPCPKADNGTCSIPDQTLIVRGSSVAVRSREKIEAEFPSIDLNRSSLEQVGDAISLPELVDAFEDREGSHRSLRKFTEKRGHDLLDTLLSGAESDTFVLVYCSPCGHIFKTKL